jgi:molybdopterin molybdotransferase
MNPEHHLSPTQQAAGPISLSQAQEWIRAIAALPQETVSLSQSLGRVCARAVLARADCPSLDSSMKDGFALQAADVRQASQEMPVCLDVRGTIVAGGGQGRGIGSGQAARIMTGGVIPPGVDAVLASEDASQQEGQVLVRASIEPGGNILPRGSDISKGSVVVEEGVVLGPTHLGLLAAAGVDRVRIHPMPRVAIAATGSELVAPGQPIGPGQVVASNMVTLQAELAARRIEVECRILDDDLERLAQAFGALLDQTDVLLTCGGVLNGDRDLTLAAMERLGVERLFHRVRIGPGKGIAMGRLGSTLIFNLPGGPPSNHVAFLLLALPGILRKGGWQEPFLPRRLGRLVAPVKGRAGWTQLIYGRSWHDRQNGELLAQPLIPGQRLAAMAQADCLIEIDEQAAHLTAGEQAIIHPLPCCEGRLAAGQYARP